MGLWRLFTGNYGSASTNINHWGGLVMDIDIIFRIAGIGILISILCIVLKQSKKEEWAEMLTLAGVVVVLILVVQLMNQLFSTVRSVFNL
jgi:stage III sporulation protein AC